jgi:signal transduction histidine kinase
LAAAAFGAAIALLACALAGGLAAGPAMAGLLALMGALAGLVGGLVLRARERILIRRLAAEHDSLVAEAIRRNRAKLSHTEHVARVGSAERQLRTGESVWSDEFHAILGLVPGCCRPSEALLLDCTHPADRAAIKEALDMVIREERLAEQNFRIIRPDGEVRTLHGRADVWRDETGQAVRLDATIQDVTERKNLEDELDGLIRELWRSNEELEQFAYVASHDLRQPLRVVGSYVSLLEEELQGQLNGESLDYMGFVRDGVRRMDRLITDLLAYSRVGRTSADVQVDMNDAIRSATGDLQFEIEDAHAVVRITDPLPVVMGDESELGRLFQNLIGNAIKYRRPDVAPDLRIGCGDAGECWRITVSDNGIGIPPEHAERVFGIFQRLHARDEFEGTGVGLAIVKKIVERHGGGIKVESDGVSGTTMVLTWPKLRLDADAS